MGERVCEAVRRQGAQVVRVEGEWDRALPLERLHEASQLEYHERLDETRRASALAFSVSGASPGGQ